ncbi:MAG: DUF6069 family protein [Acidimicrobiales bacterium]
MQDQTSAAEPTWTRRPLWQVGLTAALAAAAANVVIYAIARAADVPMELTEVFSDDFQRMPAINVALGTLLDGGVVAIALAAGCRRRAKQPRATFT